jgi:hypothetical protein
MELQGFEGMPNATFRRLTGIRKRTFREYGVRSATHRGTPQGAGWEAESPGRLSTTPDDAGVLAGIPHVSAHWTQLRSLREYGLSQHPLV